jgi:hypothetical protein
MTQRGHGAAALKSEASSRVQKVLSVKGMMVGLVDAVDGSSTGTRVPRMWAPFEAPTIRRS